MQFYPPPFFSKHIHTPLLQPRSSNFFHILCLFCMYVYLYTYEGFLLLLTSWFQFKKGPTFTYPPPPPFLPLFLFLSLSIFLPLSMSVCLSVCVSLSLSLSLARSFSHFTNLTIIPKKSISQTYVLINFHTFQKLKLDLIVAPRLHR